MLAEKTAYAGTAWVHSLLSILLLMLWFTFFLYNSQISLILFDVLEMWWWILSLVNTQERCYSVRNTGRSEEKNSYHIRCSVAHCFCCCFFLGYTIMHMSTQSHWHSTPSSLQDVWHMNLVLEVLAPISLMELVLEHLDYSSQKVTHFENSDFFFWAAYCHWLNKHL